MNCLFEALEQRRFKQARLLIDMGLKLNIKRADGKTVLIQLCYLKPECLAVNIAKALLAKNADIGLTDENGLSALSHAVLQEKEQLTMLFLKEAGDTFDINASDNNGRTPLFHAATVGNFNILKMLLNALRKYRLNVDIPDKNGVTPLIQASKNGHLLCSRYLLSEGKASSQIRDEQRFKTAKEWEHTKESIRSQKRFVLFKGILSGNHGSEGNDTVVGSRAKSANISRKPIKTRNKDEQDESRPKTAPAALEKIGEGTALRVAKKKQNQRDELTKVFNLYQCQLSEAFRAGYKMDKPKKSEPAQDPEINDNDNKDKELSEKTKWTCVVKHRRRGSLFRNGSQLKISKRNSLTPVGLNAFGGRRLSQSFPSPILRRASVSPEMMRPQQHTRPGGGLARSSSDLLILKPQKNSAFNAGRRQSSCGALSRRPLAPLPGLPDKRRSVEMPTLSVSPVIEEESEHDSESESSDLSIATADVALL